MDAARPAAVLEAPAWAARVAAHEARVAAWTEPHLERRRRREAHPVHDFLWTYYTFRPAQLTRWHPGLGVGLAGDGARRWLDLPGYVETEVDGRLVVTVDPAALPRGPRVAAAGIRTLLAATLTRPASYGCFGLHEWAMVYRQDPGDVRHDAWPLRLGAEGTDTVVESHRIRCTHFDAYRFFTPEAEPLNAVRPRPDTRVELEQPGCLHATMDLYKHAYRLSPAVGSDLLADCFALAREVRELDMRASPYDLSRLGFAPVRIETPEGKAEYAAAQRGFAERGQDLRARLLAVADAVAATPLPGDQATSAR